jgi:hypothetical protein
MRQNHAIRSQASVYGPSGLDFCIRGVRGKENAIAEISFCESLALLDVRDE